MNLDEARSVQKGLLSLMDNRDKPLVVSLHGGPGLGKSTTAAAVFVALKKLGVNVELVTEYAKDLTWEESSGKLAYQPYVAAKQLWRERRLEGKVDVIITDTSILNSLIYCDATPEFRAWILAEYFNGTRYDFLLVRNDKITYNASGRRHDLEEARVIDESIANLLRDEQIIHARFEVDLETDWHINHIVSQIRNLLMVRSIEWLS